MLLYDILASVFAAVLLSRLKEESWLFISNQGLMLVRQTLLLSCIYIAKL